MSRETVAPRNRAVSAMLSELPDWIRARAHFQRRQPQPPIARVSDPQDILRSVLARRLVFVVSTGRSGTRYLKDVLSLFRDVHAEHEPEPSFTNAFRTIATAPHVARQFWLEQKLPAIAQSQAPIYAETSHLACKGFLESGVELGLRPTLVHLVRRYRDTAQSMLALNTIPTRTFKGVRFYLGPDDRVFLPVGRDVFERWQDYQLCYWYCLEIGERARAYAERFAPLGIKVERVDLEDLHAADDLYELADRLGLGPLSWEGTRQLRHVVGRRANEKADAKRQAALTEGQLDSWEREVEAAVARRFPLTLRPQARDLDELSPSHPAS